MGECGVPGDGEQSRISVSKGGLEVAPKYSPARGPGTSRAADLASC